MPLHALFRALRPFQRFVGHFRFFYTFLRPTQSHFMKNDKKLKSHSYKKLKSCILAFMKKKKPFTSPWTSINTCALHNAAKARLNPMC